MTWEVGPGKRRKVIGGPIPCGNLLILLLLHTGHLSWFVEQFLEITNQEVDLVRGGIKEYEYFVGARETLVDRDSVVPP